MGLIETMAITSALSSGMTPLGSSLMLWGLMISTLAAAAAGIFLAVPRPRRSARVLGVVRRPLEAR